MLLLLEPLVGDRDEEAPPNRKVRSHDSVIICIKAPPIGQEGVLSPELVDMDKSTSSARVYEMESPSRPSRVEEETLAVADRGGCSITGPEAEEVRDIVSSTALLRLGLGGVLVGVGLDAAAASSCSYCTRSVE